jgi:(p)ppGpp synthase/HD superfamily hydrolase
MLDIFQSTKVINAAEFAKELHKHQFRKDGVRPYFVHLEDVARRVSQVTNNEDVIIAAFLHDGPEDIPGYTVAMVEERFGTHVADAVCQLTDVYVKSAYPELNRKTRKQLERERYRTFSDVVKWIKLSDIASNLSDDGSVLNPDGTPEVGFMGMFIREKALCLPYLRVVGDEKNEFLFAQAENILREKAEKFNVKIG